jgi:hypothetical protein
LVLWDRAQEKFVLEFFREQFKEHGCTKSLHCGIMTFCIVVPFGFGVLIVLTHLNQETEFLDTLWLLSPMLDMLSDVTELKSIGTRFLDILAPLTGRLKV